MVGDVIRIGGSGAVFVFVDSVFDSVIGERVAISVCTCAMFTDELVGCVVKIGCSRSIVFCDCNAIVDGIVLVIELRYDGIVTLQIRNLSRVPQMRFRDSIDGTIFHWQGGPVEEF